MSDSLLALGTLFSSAFISSTIAPGGSEAVLAYWINQQPTQVLALVTVATIGNTLGALTTWGLGMWAAKKYPAEHIISGQKQRAIGWLQNWGRWALLLSWLPVVGDALCFAGGWLRLSMLSSWLAIAIGKAARYSVIAYAFL